MIRIITLGKMEEVNLREERDNVTYNKKWRENQETQLKSTPESMKRDNFKLTAGLESLGIFLNDYQLSQFENYYDILIEQNKVMNLTAITNYEEVITKHFLDSLSLVKVFEDFSDCKIARVDSEFTDYNEKVNAELERISNDTIQFNSLCFCGMKMLDLGTGAGFPGIPLKIAFPEIEVLLVDSLNKRVNFLKDVISALKLDKITAIHARAEELGRKEEYREKFDLCVSRAVAKLHLLSEYCIPFVRCGGSFISYKSGKTTEEINEGKYAVEKLGGKYKETVVFSLPGTDIERGLVVINKVRKTPSLYPRNAGKITKNPLLLET